MIPRWHNKGSTDTMLLCHKATNIQQSHLLIIYI